MVDVLMKRYIAVVAFAALAGCGGGGGGATPPVVSNNAPQIVQKTIKIVVPDSSKASTRAKYVSRNTQGIGISFGASPQAFTANNPNPTAAFDVSSTSTLCTITNTATKARTCTLSV